MKRSEKGLIDAATAVRENAYAPYSNFRVGAAVETEDGESIYTGCNVESASYGLTVCAERVAIWKALSEGVRRFRAVAVVTGADVPTPPCGACRQILWEFAGDVPVVSATSGGAKKEYRMSDLLPEPFEF